MNKFINMLFVFVMFCFLSGSSLQAAELYGKKFKETIDQNDVTLTLKGLGVKSYLFVKVLVAGFYVDGRFKEQDLLGDVSKRIEVAYFYKIPGAKLAVETRRRIKLNTNQKEYNQIKSRIDEMDAYFVDLSPGDRYALTYIRGQGTFFTFNDNLVGKIEGADFAKALFAVWIGREPISEALKEKLLGK